MAMQVLRGVQRWAQELRMGSLERRIRQDPTKLRERLRAAALYCRQAEAEAELQKAVPHLEAVLGASEDAEFLHHVLTSAVGPRLFYQLPKLTARYMRKIALSPGCLEEFQSRSEFEERATPYHFANALMILKAAGETQAASELFEEAREVSWHGQRPITWESLQQTPAVHISGLTHRPFWDPKQLPLAEMLKVPVQTRVYADFVENQLKQLGPMLRRVIRVRRHLHRKFQRALRKEFKSDHCQPRRSGAIRPQIASAAARIGVISSCVDLLPLESLGQASLKHIL